MENEIKNFTRRIIHFIGSSNMDIFFDLRGNINSNPFLVMKGYSITV